MRWFTSDRGGSEMVTSKRLETALLVFLVLNGIAMIWHQIAIHDYAPAFIIRFSVIVVASILFAIFLAMPLLVTGIKGLAYRAETREKGGYRWLWGTFFPEVCRSWWGRDGIISLLTKKGPPSSG
jgi:hypothetical protein